MDEEKLNELNQKENPEEDNSVDIMEEEDSENFSEEVENPSEISSQAQPSNRNYKRSINSNYDRSAKNNFREKTPPKNSKNTNMSQKVASTASQTNKVNSNTGFQGNKLTQVVNNSNNSKGNEVKNTTRNLNQPVQSGKNQTKNIAKSQIKKLIRRHPLIIIYFILGVFIFFLIIFLLLIIIAAFSGENAGVDANYYIDPTYDYTATQIKLNNGYFEETVAIEDYIKGTAYAEFYQQYSQNVSQGKLAEAIKAYMVTIKHDIFVTANYDISTKDNGLNVGNNFSYCSVFSGCKTFIENGHRKYITIKEGDTNNYPSDAVIIPIPTGNIYDIIENAYSETKYEILAPKSLNDVLSNYNQLIVESDNTQKYLASYTENWTQSKKNYDEIIANEDALKEYYIYDIRNYASYQIGTSPTYYWPVELDPKTGKIFETQISSTFNIAKGNFGIQIAPSSGFGEIGTVAIADGIFGGCVKETKPYTHAETYTVTIIHTFNGQTTGLSSEYHNLTSCPIIGDTLIEASSIKQGDKLGTTLRNYPLEIRIKIDGIYVNPQDYIDANNPRPTSLINIKEVEGNSNKQSICLSLKSSGFSNNAVAALLANMYHESGFRPTALGDGGTSYGICQWHNGRFTKLKNYCGNSYSTIGCQLDYLVYELQNSYQTVYKSLTSNDSAYDMAYTFCYYFEVPANRSVKSSERGALAKNTMLSYVENNCN